MKISNEDLTEANVPCAENATDAQMIAFANAFPSYEIWCGLRPVQTVTYYVADGWKHQHGWPMSLTVLRTALFGEARSEKFVDYGGLGDSDEGWHEHRAYMRQILRQIERCVAADNRDRESESAIRWLKAHPSRPILLESRDTPSLAPEDLADAVRLAAEALALELRDGVEPSESLLRAQLLWAWPHTSGAIVEAERRVATPEFQGVGPVDIIARAESDGRITGMLECKWSREGKRDKIYEAAWDAVKLALATLHNEAATAYVVTVATRTAWAKSETADLFSTGTVDTVELWGRELTPVGMNGSNTVGGDCEAGGRGNMFTVAPRSLLITQVTDVPIPGTEWIIKGAQISAVRDLVEFASAPEFPERINQRWLQRHVPRMADVEFERLIVWLRHKRWSESDLQTRVYPLRSTQRNTNPARDE